MFKFSILTACHDAAPFLKQCINSVLIQKYVDIEWVIVDDCSIDNSYEILSSIGDPRIKLVRNDNRKYCASSYAKALNLATGDICGVLDSDDALQEDAVETVVDLYRRYPAIGYIYTQHFWCDEKLRVKRRGLSQMPKPNKSFIDMATKHGAHCFSHWRTFKRKLSDNAVLFKPGLKYAVDKCLGFSLEELAMGGFYGEQLYYYRYHKGNMSKTKAGGQSEACRALAKEFLKKNKRRRVFPVVELK